MKKYVASYKELGFDDEFMKEAKEQLKRFAKEIPFRKEEEETLRKLEEERLAKKNKKKEKNNLLLFINFIYSIINYFMNLFYFNNLYLYLKNINMIL